MKKIINRRTGDSLSLEEARRLGLKIKAECSAVYVEHKSVYGYASPELAEKANLRAVCEAYEAYTFAFTGTVYDSFEGFKCCVIALKNLPSDFEKKYPDFVVIG